MRARFLLRTPAAASAAVAGADTSGEASLTGWLAQLAADVAKLPTRRGPCAPPSSTDHSTRPDVRRLWAELEHASLHAHTLRESDTALALVNALCGKGYFPMTAESSGPSPAATMTWAVLAERLLTYANTEASSVRAYPGQPKATLMAAERACAAGGTGAGAHAPAPYRIRCARETLLMTGGVVPLSARAPCDDGSACAMFLNHFCNDAETRAPSAEELAAFSASLVRVLAANNTSIHFELVCDAVERYFAVLYRADGQRGADTTESAGAGASASAGVVTGPAVSGLTVSFAEALCAEVKGNALGARLCTAGVAFLVESATIAAATAAAASGVSLGMQQLLASEQFLRQDRAAQGLQLRLVRTAARALHQEYERPTVAGSTGPGHRNSPLRIAPLLMRLHTFLDSVFQYNVTQGNVMGLAEGFPEEVRGELSLATLRALRVEATAPDVFLRQSMEVVDRCPPSMAVEAELIAGKAALFDYFDLNEEGRAALYDDLVTSLRNLVELRPRGDGPSAYAQSAYGGEDDEGTAFPEDGLSAGDVAASSAVLTSSGSHLPVMDAASRRRMQESHGRVVRVLCESLDVDRINEAYSIVITHKYHGLLVTTEVIAPLLEVMARRGDCRVFNLVDLCVLYSNSTVDMPSIACLFRACAVAGDYYRAHTLLQLLEDVVPGFLLKAPAEVHDSLRELRVLPQTPLHLFVSEEDKLVRAALAGVDTAAATTELRPLPSLGDTKS